MGITRDVLNRTLDTFVVQDERDTCEAFLGALILTGDVDIAAVLTINAVASEAPDRDVAEVVMTAAAKVIVRFLNAVALTVQVESDLAALPTTD